MAERALRIGVDGRELVGRVTGVGRYVGEVLKAWGADPTFAHELVVFTPSLPPAALATQLGKRVTWIVVPGPGGGTVWEQWHLPRAVRPHNLDVFFAGAYTAPVLLACPFVVVVYDVSYFAHPEWFGFREGLRRRWLTRLATARASSVVTISNFSATEIATHLRVSREKIAIAPCGAPAVQRPAARPAGSTVLYVGSLFTRRLIPELISGFAHIADDVPAARLVLVGDNRTRPHVDPRAVAASFGVRDRIEWREYVTDAELDELYASARVFAFLSSYEGFALTPLEAIARGVPPVLLDTTVAHEIYDGAALFVDRDSASIGHALRVLLGSDATHAKLVEAGDSLLGRYSWTSTADTIRTALERAAEAPR